jgi:hypothetical protein
MMDFIKWQTVVFSLGIFVAVLIFRKVVEGLYPSLRKTTPRNRKQMLWESVVLPVLPPVLGGIFALLTPELIQPSLVTMRSQVLFGAVCGFLSTYAYMILKAVVKKNFGVEEPDGREGDSLKPPGGKEGGKDSVG